MRLVRLTLLVQTSRLHERVSCATLLPMQIARVDLLLTCLLRLCHCAIQLLLVLVPLLDQYLVSVLGAILLMDILVPLIPARLIVLMIIGSAILLRHHVGTLLLVLARGLLCVSVHLLQLWMLRLLGYNRVCLSGLVPVSRTLLRVRRSTLSSLLLIGVVHPSPFTVQQECVSHF